MMLALTWNKPADEVWAYYNGVQEGAPVGGLGVWAGVLLNTHTNIGASTTVPAGVWDGFAAHGMVFNSVLGAADIADLYSV